MLTSVIFLLSYILEQKNCNLFLQSNLYQVIISQKFAALHTYSNKWISLTQHQNFYFKSITLFDKSMKHLKNH